MKILFPTRLTKQIVTCLYIPLLFACADISSTNTDIGRVNLSGKWQYEQITSNAETQEYITSHYHVSLVDNGNTVFLQQCSKRLDDVFSRSHDVLVNSQGHKLHIIEENTIESVSVPDLRKLTRLNNDADEIHNAGVVTLQSNEIQSVSADSEVCAQKITQIGSDKIQLRISIPFDDSYMEIELVIDDINSTSNNIEQMEFYSPSLARYYGSDKLETLSGNAKFSILSNDRIKVEFVVTTVLFNVFPGDTIAGSIDVHL